MRIVLRLDAGAATGFGHAIRSSALIQAFGADLDLTVAGEDADAISSVFPAARYRSVKVEGFAAILADVRPDVVIVDLPKTDASLWALARASGALVVAVDDEGGAISADFVINGAGPQSVHHYPLLKASDRALTGPAYALLRPAFGRVRWKAPGDQSLCIIVGSGTRARDWALMLAQDGLRDVCNGPIKMTVGAFFSPYEKLRAHCQISRIELMRGLGAEDIAEVSANSQAALITGGMIMPETLAIGTPAIVFPQVKNLIPETRWFAQRGVILDLGYDGGFDRALIASHIESLLNNPNAARAQSDRGRALVDGHGAERCAKLITQAVLARRQHTPC